MDAALRLLIAGVLAVATAPSPELLQSRYDSGRDAQERAYARGDSAAAARAYRDVRWAERYDFRPAGWRGARDVPRTPPLIASRGPKRRDAQIAAAFERIGAAFNGEAAIWYHDLRTGAWAGWRADATLPAASLVKLGVVAAALHSYKSPARSPLWYDLRQLTGWSSNLAANRIVRKVGGERVVQRALYRLGARASTYPGPYRAGTVSGVHGYSRVTTARDLGRMLYSLHAAAAGNRYVARRSGLTASKARLALALLADAHPRGDTGGLIRPHVAASTPVARKEGWISDFRGTAAIVYGRSPKVVVVLVYRRDVTLAAARAFARRVLDASVAP